MKKDISEYVVNVRKKLGLSMEEMSDLFAIHPKTLRNWETGISQPNRHQFEIMEAISKAKEKDKDIGDALKSALVMGGVALGLWVVLNAVFNKEKQQ